MICNSIQIILGWHDQEGWVGRASSKHGSEKTYRVLVGKPEEERQGIYVKRRIIIH